MLDIIVLSVGKIKENYWQQAINEYVKRLRPYAKIIFSEVLEEKVTQVSDRQRILSKEGSRLIKLIPSDCMLIALDRTGKDFNSTEWSQKLYEWSTFGRKITFIIGGPLGISAEILSKAQLLLSLSKMTFTHQLTQVILLEQIYRGVMIAKGKQYHY